MRYLALLLLLPVLSCGPKGSKSDKNADEKTIPGLTATFLHDPFAKKGFSLEKSTVESHAVWTSKSRNESNEFKVVSTGLESGEVISVQASVVSMLTLDQAARDFFGEVASVQFQHADPQKAKEWVLTHFDGGGQTVIGDMNYQVQVNNETSRTLKISVPEE